MIKPQPLQRIRELAPYVPGLSIAEIRQKYGLSRVIKLASNENPLGASPLAMEAIRANAGLSFRYPQGGNPRLVAALAEFHNVPQDRIAVGNGSDEIIDLLVRMLARDGEHNIVCFEPCFSIYPIQARIAGIEVRRTPLGRDFKPDMDALLSLVDEKTRLVFVTTPDNPSAFCPPRQWTATLASRLASLAPAALLVVDEAYMDFAPREMSLLANGELPENAVFLRTFSKSFALAGMRIGYAVAAPEIADAFWRSRLPFSVNILAEEAALAALADVAFREATMHAVHVGRRRLTAELEQLGCRVWPSYANFLLFQLPEKSISALECFTRLLHMGVIIRSTKSYGMPEHLRVSIGNEEENSIFISCMRKILGGEE